MGRDLVFIWWRASFLGEWGMACPIGDIGCDGGGGGFKKNHRMGSTGWPTPSAPIINHNLIIDLFFVNQVDIYINTLEVAVHAYYNISWFFFYCEVASIFHKKITVPIKRCWGVDEYKDICFRLIMESCKTDLTPSFKISNPWWMKLISVWVVSID